jgi:hypothetical protein
MVADMTQFGTWVSYGGDARIELAIALLGAAGGLAYTGTRLKLPVQAPKPGKGAAAIMISAWGVSILAFLICVSVFAQKIIQQYPGHHGPTDPIAPVTFTAVVLTFIIIFWTSPRADSGARLRSAFFGAVAAPMIFELPFDLIVMARIYPPVMPDPALYRAVFFVPLFLIELTTLWLLTLSPMVKLSRGTFYSFAAMLAVFAVWSLDGFAYPAAPLPTVLNVVSKLLAFVTALSLFLPQRRQARAPDPEPAPAEEIVHT